MPESLASIYSAIFVQENIWYQNFTWSRPNSQEIVNSIQIKLEQAFWHFSSKSVSQKI